MTGLFLLKSTKFRGFFAYDTGGFHHMGTLCRWPGRHVETESKASMVHSCSASPHRFNTRGGSSESGFCAESTLDFSLYSCLIILMLHLMYVELDMWWKPYVYPHPDPRVVSLHWQPVGLEEDMQISTVLIVWCHFLQEYGTESSNWGHSRSLIKCAVVGSD